MTILVVAFSGISQSEEVGVENKKQTQWCGGQKQGSLMQINEVIAGDDCSYIWNTNARIAINNEEMGSTLQRKIDEILTRARADR